MPSAAHTAAARGHRHCSRSTRRMRDRRAPGRRDSCCLLLSSNLPTSASSGWARLHAQCFWCVAKIASRQYSRLFWPLAVRPRSSSCAAVAVLIRPQQRGVAPPPSHQCRTQEQPHVCSCRAAHAAPSHSLTLCERVQQPGWCGEFRVITRAAAPVHGKEARAPARHTPPQADSSGTQWRGCHTTCHPPPTHTHTSCNAQAHHDMRASAPTETCSGVPPPQQ
jgi:hypothetical protein